jgi:hypothetical protein
MRSSLFLLFVFWALGPGIAQAGPTDTYLKCQKSRAPIADKHEKRANKILAKHDAKLIELFSKALSDVPDGPESRAALRRGADNVLAQHPIADAREQLVDHLLDRLRNPGDPENLEDPEFKCPRKSDTKRWSRDSLDTYEQVLGEARDDVKNRLSFETMADDEGLAIIAFYAFGYAETVRINRLGAMTGSFDFGPVNNGEYFKVVKLKAGDYRWEKITQKFWGMGYYFTLDHRELRFSVAPGKLNYTGAFVFDASGQYARISLNDRTAIVLTMLEQRYPDLLERFEITNSLVPEDRFINFYLNEKSEIDETIAND